MKMKIDLIMYCTANWNEYNVQLRPYIYVVKYTDMLRMTG